MGKSSINGPFSMAMLNNQMVGGKEIASFMRSEVLRRPKIHPEIVEQREEQRKNKSDWSNKSQE